MTTALITGISGQDGSYLGELLINKGYAVVGLSRNPDSARKKLGEAFSKEIDIVQWDMRSADTFREILHHYAPNEVYNFSACSSGKGMFDDSVYITEANGIAVVLMLEALRNHQSDIRFCQASSSEMFGEAESFPQNELTPFRPRSPYGAAKLLAHNMINIYRKKYATFACSAILFNHESPKRPMEFVTRKISSHVAQIKLGQADKLVLGDLDVGRDWGYAKDYVRAMWLMLQKHEAEDYVLSSGTSHTVRQLCELAFGHVGLDYKDHVTIDASLQRTRESFKLIGDSSKARKKLNWQPSIDFSALVSKMVDSDIELYSRINNR